MMADSDLWHTCTRSSIPITANRPTTRTPYRSPRPQSAVGDTERAAQNDTSAGLPSGEQIA